MEALTHSFISCYGMDLRAEHDAGEEREEKSFKHTQEGQYEGKGARHDPITPLKVAPNTAEEKPGHHAQAKH